MGVVGLVTVVEGVGLVEGAVGVVGLVTVVEGVGFVAQTNGCSVTAMSVVQPTEWIRVKEMV